jgi:hypothetical protein
MEDFPQGSLFDVVTSSHVIEHVFEPDAFLRSVRTNLRDGGMLWLATPNVESIGHRAFGSCWRGLEPPRHIQVFNQRALERLLTEAGFSEVRFHRRGRGARYILNTSRRIAMDARHRVPILPVSLVDLLASVSARLGEELVVTAKAS